MGPFPADFLWGELRGWFEDDHFHAGPDVRFGELTAAGVERLWDYLRTHAEPIDRRAELWHNERSESVRVVDVPDAVALVQQHRIGAFTFALHGIRVDGVAIPPLGVWIEPGSLAIYWWVGEDPAWTVDALGAFAQLIGDLRTLEPDSPLTIEWGTPDEFFGPIDRYLAAAG